MLLCSNSWNIVFVCFQLSCLHFSLPASRQIGFWSDWELWQNSATVGLFGLALVFKGILEGMLKRSGKLRFPQNPPWQKERFRRGIHYRFAGCSREWLGTVSKCTGTMLANISRYLAFSRIGPHRFSLGTPKWPFCTSSGVNNWFWL